MPLTVQPQEYKIDGKTFDGALIRDDAPGDERKPKALPCVLIFHGWEGRSDGQVEFGERLARLGYAAFACDLFGKGIRGDMAKDNSLLIAPFLEDRKMLRERLLANVATVRKLPGVRPDRIAAIGFCFGGLCVLDLARAGSDVRAVVSFHGLFGPPQGLEKRPIQAKICAFHGWDDPMVPPAQVQALGAELTAAGADWQLHAFGRTKHAFMVQDANRPEAGIQYDERAAQRAWKGAALFLEEALAG